MLIHFLIPTRSGAESDGCASGESGAGTLNPAFSYSSIAVRAEANIIDSKVSICARDLAAGSNCVAMMKISLSDCDELIVGIISEVGCLSNVPILSSIPEGHLGTSPYEFPGTVLADG